MIEIEEKFSSAEELITIEDNPPIKATKDERPYVLNAKVYKLKSGFVDYAIYITVSYKEEDNKKRPFEIFIHSKDLSRAAEYAVLTRLISAIFRRSEDPLFIIEELKNIYDPNGGYLKDGKYVASIYAEIGQVLETFFEDVGLIKKKEKKNPGILSFSTISLGNKKENSMATDTMKICPKCNQKTLKLESGCTNCVNPECNYSKCD